MASKPNNFDTIEGAQAAASLWKQYRDAGQGYARACGDSIKGVPKGKYRVQRRAMGIRIGWLTVDEAVSLMAKAKN